MEITNVAVLGTGVMGGQIAAHLANVGINVFAFDINQETAEKNIELTSSMKPSPYYNPKYINRISPVNYNDHLDKIKECQWIVEVVAEKIEIKHDLFSKISSFIPQDAILTSNTSGLNLKTLSDGMSESLKKRFFITHFFNPPRYMRLVEFIVSESNDREIVNAMVMFFENILGKGVVFSNDTPNFIANRIGIYGMMKAIDKTIKYKLSVDEVDMLTGSLIGRPKSATYRTADLAGLDVLSFVASTALNKCKDDDENSIYKTPDFIEKLIERGSLGQKTKEGFYKKIDKGVIHSLDFNTLEYTKKVKRRFDSVKVAKEFVSIPRRILSFMRHDDNAAKFIKELTLSVLAYSAKRVGDASNDIVSIDNAMKWGFGWSTGPFEMWDDIGVEESIELMKLCDIQVPEWVVSMVDSNYTSFYLNSKNGKYFYDINTKDYVKIDQGDNVISFGDYKTKSSIIHQHWSASLLDLGDGVAGVNLHSVLKRELNPIDGSIVQTLLFAINWVKENNYKGLVLSGDGANFSAGANLNLILDACYRKDYDSINTFTKHIQDILQALRFAPFPVIAAPYGLVLGGGCETVNACDKIVAAAETYIGLVEVGVGLIPGAGGNLRMISNLSKKIKTSMPGAFPIVQKAFETIGFAKVGTSAYHGQSLGYIRKDDIIITNRDHILKRAKDEVISMSNDYVAPEVEEFKLPGTTGRLVIEGTVKGFVKSKKISEHDSLIAKKLAYVLTGGKKAGPFTAIDEQYLLDIEREMFLSLCGEQKSIERIEYMLKRGKPLRN